MFGSREAALATGLCQRLRRARDREIDLAVAACAIAHGASFWTLNAGDFTDVPGLVLVDPAA